MKWLAEGRLMNEAVQTGPMLYGFRATVGETVQYGAVFNYEVSSLSTAQEVHLK